MKDIALDIEAKIAYALTADGSIIGKSYEPRKNKPMIDFVLPKDNSRWTQIKFFTAKKKTRKFNAIALSKNGNYLLVNDSVSEAGGVKNTISLYKLDKNNNEKPVFVTKAEILTNWNGGNFPLFLKFLDLDYFNHMDMKVTINGDYVVMGITMCTGLLYAFILKNGQLFNILKRIRIHKRKVFLKQF